MGARMSLGLCMVLCILGTRTVAAQEEQIRSADEQAIRAAVNEYQAAMAKGDAKALAELWAKDGEYIDDAGNIHPAGELIAEVAQADPQGPRDASKVTASKIRFLSPDVALDDGESEVVLPEGAPPAQGHYHATWIKQAGRWRLASVCEIASPAPAEAGLPDLGWMVGNWTADFDGVKWESAVQWNATGTFLLRDTKAVHDGKVLLRGSQRIGWDPLAGQLKSWSFDSDGGYSEAAWTKDGASWVADGVGVLPDGRRSSATTIMTFDGQNSYTRQTRDVRIQGEPAPDQSLRFTRQPNPAR